MFTALALASLLQGATLHVAAGGDDSGAGSAERPLASLAAALARAKAGDSVVVHTGSYRIERTLELGAAQSRVALRAEGDVRLHGGLDLPHAAWHAVDADLAQQLAPAAREQAQQLDLRVLGVERIDALEPRGFGREGSMAPVELFVDGEAQELARWPDVGFARTGAVVDDGTNAGGRPTFAFADARLARWKAGDVWAYGYWHWDWADESLPVAAVGGARVALGELPRYPLLADRPFWFENVLEELDRSGEYFVDRAGLRLVAWLPRRDGAARLSLVREPLLRARDASDVRIEGFTFETSRACALEIEGGSGVRVERCVFRDLGLNGVRVRGGTAHAIRASRFADLGEGGCALDGGDRATLTPAGHVVEDCVFERYSRRARTYRPGVLVAGVGMSVRRSTFRDAPHCAILFSGNDHLFEGNYVREVLKSTGDGGAFYAGRDWTARGTLIRGNLFERLHGEHRYENAVYLDDQLCGITVERNVFVDCFWGALVGGGRDNVLRDNLFVDCGLAMHLDARGLGWAASMRDTLVQRLEQVPYASAVWRTRYPQLVGLLDGEPMAPRGNVVAGNVLLRSGKLDADVAAEFRRGARMEGNVELDAPVAASIADGVLTLRGREGVEALRAWPERQAYGPAEPPPGAK